jgi:hypothetical protein
MACPMCGHDASTTLPLPVEPLYDGEVAAMLVPMSLDGFRRLLQRYRDQLPITATGGAGGIGSTPRRRSSSPGRWSSIATVSPNRSGSLSGR